MNPSKSAPELPAYDTGKHLVVWCAYCRDWHLHGRGVGDDDGSGHRWAHCRSASNSSYEQTGYVLRYAGPASPEIIRDMKRRRPRGVNPLSKGAV